MKKFFYSLVVGFLGLFVPSISFASTCEINGRLVECPAWFDGFIIGFWIVALLLIALIVVSLWKIFTKAGKPGWTSIIPIYNIIVMFQITGIPLWMIILCFIPGINIIPALYLPYMLAKSFGKGIGFTVGLIILPFIFYPILAFGVSTYRGPSVAQHGYGLGMQHPELQAGESFLGNFSQADFQNKLRWQTKRLGQVAYSADGTRETNPELFPVFVHSDELHAAGLNV